MSKSIPTPEQQKPFTDLGFTFRRYCHCGGTLQWIFQRGIYNSNECIVVRYYPMKGFANAKSKSEGGKYMFQQQHGSTNYPLNELLSKVKSHVEKN